MIGRIIGRQLSILNQIKLGPITLKRISVVGTFLLSLVPKGL
jgi:hypothetical protein